jgi:hypothetical protein
MLPLNEKNLKKMEKKDPIALGDLVIDALAKGKTQTTLAAELGLNRISLGKYKRIGLWGAKTRAIIEENKLDNTTILKAAEKFSNEEEAANFLSQWSKNINSEKTKDFVKVPKTSEDKSSKKIPNITTENRIKEKPKKKNLTTKSVGERITITAPAKNKVSEKSQKKEIIQEKKETSSEKKPNINIAALSKKTKYKSTWTGVFDKTLKDHKQVILLPLIIGIIFALIAWSSSSLTELGYSKQSAWSLATLLEACVVLGTIFSLEQTGIRKIIPVVLTLLVMAINYSLMSRGALLEHDSNLDQITVQKKKAIGIDTTIFDSLITSHESLEKTLLSDKDKIRQKIEAIESEALHDLEKRPNYVTSIKNREKRELAPKQKDLIKKEEELSVVRKDLRQLRLEKAQLVKKSLEQPNGKASEIFPSVKRKMLIANIGLGSDAVLRFGLICFLAFLLHIVLSRRKAMENAETES